MPKPKKSASPKKSRTPAEQKAINERMAKMRAGRKNSKTGALLTSGASLQKNLKIPPGAAAAGPGNTVQPAANASPAKILEWRVEKLSDFASIPLVHLQKALHFFDRAIRKATMENQAVETFTYTEQGAVLVKTVAVDPLA